MQMRFKKGDLVVVAPKGGWAERYLYRYGHGNDIFIKLAESLIGSTVRINEVFHVAGGYFVDADHNEWLWREEMFEPLLLPDMSDAEELI